MQVNRLIASVMALVSLALCGWTVAAEAGTFTVKEVFGASHPDQIVDFHLDQPIDPANTVLIGPNGQQVPYQLIKGGKKIAIRTHLPAFRLPILVSCPVAQVRRGRNSS